MSKQLVLPQSMPSAYLHLWDAAGGPAVQIPVSVDAKGYLNLQGVNVDMVNVAQADVMLATVPAVNLNSTAEQQLFLMPQGFTICYITRVVLRLASLSLSTVSMAFGWNAGTDNDVIATATHVELTGPTLCTVLIPKVGQAVGGANGAFSIKNTIAQGVAATCTIDVWGCLF